MAWQSNQGKSSNCTRKFLTPCSHHTPFCWKKFGKQTKKNGKVIIFFFFFKVPAEAEACESMFWSTPGFKEKERERGREGEREREREISFACPGFFAEGAFTSVSSVASLRGWRRTDDIWYNVNASNPIAVNTMRSSTLSVATKNVLGWNVKLCVLDHLWVTLHVLSRKKTAKLRKQIWTDEEITQSGSQEGAYFLYKLMNTLMGSGEERKKFE